MESLHGLANSSSAEGPLAVSALTLLNLWLQAHMVNHRGCLLRLFCEGNERAARGSLHAWALAEVGR